MKIQYTKYLCAFIDILGYSTLIEDASSKAKAITIIRHINDAVENGIRRNIEIQNSEELKYKIFSDNISISIPYPNNKDEGLDNVLFSFIDIIIFIQAELLNYGIIIRGAISSDYHFENENMIFSRALIKSYRLESKEAVYPRIIIDHKLIEELKESFDDNNFSSWEKVILKDSDLYYFIDYLSYVEYLEYDIDRENYLSKHKDFIIEKIKSSPNSYVLTKYLWLAKYHNYKITQLSNHDDDKLLINNDLLSFTNKNFEPTAYIIFYEIKKSNKPNIIVYHFNQLFTVMKHFKANYPNATIVDTRCIYDPIMKGKIINDLKNNNEIGSLKEVKF